MFTALSYLASRLDISYFWPTRADIKEFGSSMSPVLAGGVSYLSQTRPILLFQAEFVLYLKGRSCTVEQPANPEQCLAFSETDQEGAESLRVVLLHHHSPLGQGSSWVWIHTAPFAFTVMSKEKGCVWVSAFDFTRTTFSLIISLKRVILFCFSGMLAPI